ncbi:MAG: transcriptional regulator NrdR [Actinomycetota bacterium]
MRCPTCDHDDTRVVDSRPADAGAAVRRRRTCPSCAGRFTTYERVEPAELVVIKRSGHRQPYDPAKVERGVRLAVKNRPVDASLVTAIVEEVDRAARELGPELDTDQVGRLVLERLEPLDEVAYLRFASVHRSFDDAAEFAREAGRLRNGGSGSTGGRDAERSLTSPDRDPQSSPIR